MKAVSDPTEKNAIGEIGSLCWYCDRGRLMCSWERKFKPVAGWTAVEVEPKTGLKGNTYHVYDCPLFKRGKPTREPRRI